MAKQQNIKNTKFGEHTGSYYGTGNNTENKNSQEVKPQSTSNTPSQQSTEQQTQQSSTQQQHASQNQEQQTIEKKEQPVVPLDEGAQVLQNLAKINYAPKKYESKYGLGIDYSSYQLRQWNKDKNNKVIKYVGDNAIALPEVAKVLSDPMYKAKIENDAKLAEMFEKVFPTDTKPVQPSSTNPFQGTYYDKVAKQQAKSNGIPQMYGYSDKIPMSIQKTLTGRIIPSLTSDTEKKEYSDKNGLDEVSYNDNADLYKNAKAGTVSLLGIDKIAKDTEQYGNKLLDTTFIDKIKALSLKGNEIDKYYNDVIASQRKEFSKSNEDVQAYQTKQKEYVDKVKQIQEFQKDDKIKQFETLSQSHNSLVKEYKEKLAPKQEYITKAETELNDYMSTFKQDEDKKYIVSPDDAVVKQKIQAEKAYSEFIDSLKGKNGEITIKNKEQLLKKAELEKRVQDANELIEQDMQIKEAKIQELQKNIDAAYGEDLLNLRTKINDIEKSDIMQAYYNKTDEVINKYAQSGQELGVMMSDLAVLKGKAEQALKNYETTDKNEKKYQQDLLSLKEGLIKIDKTADNSWLHSLYDRYGENITPDIIQNEYTKTVNQFKYGQLAKQGLVPSVASNEDKNIAEVLTSQEYQFATTQDKKILLNEIYSQSKGKISRQSFFDKYKKYIYEPLDVVLLKIKALELQRQSDLLKKSNPNLYKGTYESELVGQDGATIQNYRKSSNENYSDLSDKIISRINNIPVEKQGILSDFWKGLKSSVKEGNNWIPVLGGFIEASEQKQIYEAYKAIENHKASFEQKRLVETIESFRTVTSRYSQDGMTSYNVGNKYFPQMIKFIGEMYAIGGISKAVGGGLSTLASESEILQNTGVLFNNFAKLVGASDESIALLQKLSTRPAGILLRAFGASQTVGLGSTLAWTYDKLMPYTMSQVDPETLEIKDYHAHEAEFKEFSDAYLKSSIQNAIEFGTEEMGFIVDEPLGLVRDNLLSTISKKVKGWSIKSRAVKGFLEMADNPELYDIVTKSGFYKKVKELLPYTFIKGGKLSYAQIHSLPAEVFEEILGDVFNDMLDHQMGNVKPSQFDNDSYIKNKFVEVGSIMLPLMATTTILGLGNIAVKSFHVATTDEYKPDDVDLEFINIDEAKAASIFPFFRHKRTSLKAYQSIVSDLMNKDGELSDDDITKISNEIDRLEQKREIKLARLAQSLLDKRIQFEQDNAELGTDLSFKDYYKRFEQDSKLVKSLVQGTLKDNQLDQTIVDKVKDRVKDDSRLSDEVENLQLSFQEYSSQKEQKLIPDSYTFKDFFSRETQKIAKIEQKLNNYLGNGGTVNFQQMEEEIKNTVLSQQKSDELNSLLEQAKTKFLENQDVTVENIVFDNTLGVQRSFTDTGKSNVSQAVEKTLEDIKNSGVNEKKLTDGIGKKDGLDFDLRLNQDGKLYIGNSNSQFSYDTFKKYVVENIGHIKDNVRKALFFTLGNNESLSQEQRYDLLKSINAKLSEDLAENKIDTQEALKQMSLLNEALTSSNITFSVDEIGADRLNGSTVYAFFKGNFNYDKDSRKFFLTGNEFNRAMNFLSTVRNYDKLVSDNKINLLMNKMVSDDSYNFYPSEEESETISDSINGIKDKIKSLRRKDVLNYLTGLRDNKQMSRAQINAVAQIILNTARNFKRMGIVENEIDFLNLLPQLRQLRVNMTASNKRLSNEDILLLQTEGWHGSPHDVDKFSTDFIGTGEGAQAFGWGLYFTDLESIAKMYAEKLTPTKVFVDGKVVDRKEDFFLYKAAYDIANLGYERAVERNKALVSNGDSDAKVILDTIEGLKEKNVKFGKDAKLYKVTLHKDKTPDQYTWLEWDKPLNKEQYDKVKSRLQQDKHWIVDRVYENEQVKGQRVNGQRVYSDLSTLFGSDKQASLFLLESGIDGIKYPAESVSRGATSDNARGFNYVVFDENAITIEEKILFQKDENIKGFYNPVENIIVVLKSGDVSTIIHELGHAFRFMLKNAADAGNVKAAEKLKTFNDFAMGEEGKKWYEENIVEGEHSLDNYKFVNELWARSFERYLRDGSYGTGIKDVNFKNLLNDFKDWLTGIYESVKTGALNIKLTKDVKNMFEDIIGNKISVENDLLAYIKDKFGRFSTRKRYDKQDVIDLLEKAKKGIDPAVYKESMEEIHRIVNAYKNQYIAQRYKGNSKLLSHELRALLVTPRHTNLDHYISDIKMFESIVSDSRMRYTFRQMLNLRKEATRKSAISYKNNIQFYSAMKKLARIDYRSITNQVDLETYNKLLKAKPNDFGSSFIDISNKFIQQSEQYKNDKLLSQEQSDTENKIQYEISEQALAQTRSQKIDSLSKLRDYAVNVSDVNMIKDNIQSEFFSIDLNNLTDSELNEYSSLLNGVIRSDNYKFNFSSDYVNFTTKYIARVIDNKLNDDITKHSINMMSKLNNRLSNRIDYLRVLTSRLFNPFGYGMAEHYNLKDYLNFFDGVQDDYSGTLVNTIFSPLESAHDKHRQILSDVFTLINKYRQDGKIKNGGFNRIGIKWLLSQKPDIDITEDYFKPQIDEVTGEEGKSLIEQIGLDPEEVIKEIGMTLRADEFYEKDNNGVWKKKEDINKDRFDLYSRLLDNRMQYLKDSIMVSFGEKPEWMSDEDFKSHLDEQLSNPIIYLHNIHSGDSNIRNIILSSIQNKKAETLHGTGFSSISDLIDNIDNISSDLEDEFMNLGVSLFDRLNSGEFSDGVSMREMSENYTAVGRKFTEIKNYAPIIRYITTSADTKDVLSLESGLINDKDGNYTFRTGINISNQFTKTRNKLVSSMETNAFNMIEKRFDQELFYMLNEPHRLVLKELFNKKDGFFDQIDKRTDEKGNVVFEDTTKRSKNYIKNLISLYYKRNMSPAKLALRNSPVLSKIHKIIQDFRIASLAPIRSSFAQITSTFLAQENMLGDPYSRLQDILSGYSDLFSDTDTKNEFLRIHAPEIYNRGLTDYDLGANKEAINVSSLYSKYYRNDFSSELGILNELLNSFKNNKTAIEKALLPMVFCDRAAARASFFASYRNYCNYNGIKVDFKNADKDAVNYALSNVRRTQNTDNELYKSGIISGLSSQDSGRGFFDITNHWSIAPSELFRQAYWNFKSFSLADQNNLAIQFVKALHTEEASLDNFFNSNMSIVYNLIGKMFYQYIKSASKAYFIGISTYIAYMMNMGYTGDDDKDNVLMDLLKGEFGDIYDKSKKSFRRAKNNTNDVWNTEISSDDEKRDYLSGSMYNATKALISEFQVNSMSGALAANLARLTHQSILDTNEEIGNRMEKMYNYSDEADMLGLLSDIFGISIVYGEGGNKYSQVNSLSNTSKNILEKIGINFKEKPQDMSYSDMVSIWFFLSQLFGVGLFGKLPFSFPSIKKFAEDIDKKNREDKKEMNQDSEEPEINNEEKYNTDSEESVTEDSEDN